MINVLQCGLFSKWQEVGLTSQLLHIKKFIKNKNESNEKLSLNQISLAFNILLFGLPFSLAILLIEVLFLSINNLNIFHKYCQRLLRHGIESHIR